MGRGVVRAAMPPAVTVRLFATAREAVGRATLSWELPPEGASVAELVRALGDAHPPLARILRVSRLVRNGHYVEELSERLRPRDELAVHPPYGGG